MNENLHNHRYLKERRRELRNNLTPAEASLWKALQNKQLEGRKFRRQHSVGNYILDFYCPAEQLAVELDGAGHFTAAGIEADRVRDKFLGELGITVLRFENRQVFEQLEMVLEKIRVHFKEVI